MQVTFVACCASAGFMRAVAAVRKVNETECIATDFLRMKPSLSDE